MESLIIEKTETTPEIKFNVGKLDFSMKGESRPENVLTFFTPVLNWVNKFKTWASNLSAPLNKSLQFHFKIEYYNSSSAKFIYNILNKMVELKDEGIHVKIFWYYDELDEDLLENGQEFEKILGLDFEYKPQSA